MKQEKVEKYSIRKFKVGVGSALIGLSFLGATGALDNIPILNQLGIQSVYAAQGDTRTIEVTWLAEKSFAEIGKNQATTVDNGDGTFTTTFTPLPGKYAPSRVKLYQHDLPNAINVVAHDWLENLPDDGRHSNTNEPSDFSLGGITGNGNSAIINGAELEGKKLTPTFYFTNIRYADGSRGFTLARALGTKSSTSEKVLNATTRYEKDPSREKGQPNEVVVEAKNGKEVETTDYTFRRQDGSRVDSMHSASVPTGELNSVNPDDYITEDVRTKTEAPVNGVVKVAAKDKVVEKELPSHVRYVGDENKENSTDPVRTEGKKGKEVTTTTYAVDSKTGTISESTKTERTEEPTDTVVTIGTKPKVELIKKDGRTIERTTRYRVIEATGGVVITTTDKLLSSNGEGALPPVVDVPEFNGGVNGDADGNASIHDVPEFNGGVNGDLDGNALINEAPEFNGGVNGDLDGNAAIHDAPEYTGPLAGNGLTGEGEMVEPPVVDVPEFDLSKLPKEVKKEPKQEIPNVGTGLNSFNDGRKKPAQATEIVPVGTTKEELKAEIPKDVSTPVTLEQKNDEQGKQAPVQTASSKKEMKELPNTGTASNAALTLAGVTFAMFGTVMLAKKKD